VSVAKQDNFESEILAFLTSALGSADIGRQDDIFALGYVNSLFALELVTFIERRFAAEVDVDDLDLDNFRSVEKMAELVRRKGGAPARTAL
jgi:acyl carrier protein